MAVYYSTNTEVNKLEIECEVGKDLIVGMDEIFSKLSDEIVRTSKRSILICFDCYIGIDYEKMVEKFKGKLKERGFDVKCFDIIDLYRFNDEINSKIVSPSLNGKKDFGRVFKGRLKDFMNGEKIRLLRNEILRMRRKRSSKRKLAIILTGPGSAIPVFRRLCDNLIYVDISREELFNRFEKNPTLFLASRGEKLDLKTFLRRFYYVDSQVLDRHKRSLMMKLDYYISANDPQNPVLLRGEFYRRLIDEISSRPFMVKMLYYPVSWGGNWLKKMKNLSDEMVNSGQGFILANENGVIVDLKGNKVEIPFQNILWLGKEKIIGGKVMSRCLGTFPFAYWYDDGMEGGNMAIQVHPNGTYMRKKFNEPMRQDESYYILHTGEGAKTYLGLKEDADVDELKELAVRSEKHGIPFDHDRFINSVKTKPGDYLLIPAGTVHASGKNQVVVEVDWVITAYSPGYTFHIYDYLRPDLNGSLRSIHIEHSFNVIKKNRRESWVMRNLKQKPRKIRGGDNWAEYLLGRRMDMLFEVRRLEFSDEIEDDTNGIFHVLTLVEGKSVGVEIDGKTVLKFDFPDTIIVPACVGKYRLVNLSDGKAKVLKAQVRSD